MLRTATLALVAVICAGALARAEPGMPTPVMRPPNVLRTAMPDDGDIIVRPAPSKKTKATPKPSPSPSPSVSPSPLPAPTPLSL